MGVVGERLKEAFTAESRQDQRPRSKTSKKREEGEQERCFRRRCPRCPLVAGCAEAQKALKAALFAGVLLLRGRLNQAGEGEGRRAERPPPARAYSNMTNVSPPRPPGYKWTSISHNGRVGPDID